MTKRIYSISVKKWAIGSGISATTIIGLLFLYLTSIGAIEITGFSGDQICAGTIDDPCYAYINLTAKEDIFIYPIGYDPWGRNTLFEFSPGVKDWKFQRSWGKGWRDIPLNETCTGTWCGAPNSDGVSYSYVFRKDREYQLRVIAYKNDPSDFIKWAVNYEDKEYLDPAWLPIQNWTIDGDSIYMDDSKVFINVTPHTSNNPVIEFTSKVYTGDVDIVFGFDTDKAKPTSAKINPQEELVQKSYTCEESFNYTVSPKYAWCYINESIVNNQTNESEWRTRVIFEREFESGNLQDTIIYWNELETVWDDISGAFDSVDYEFQGFNKWHYKKNIPITQGELYKLKIELQSQSWTNDYKYFFGIKPSSETLEEAISNGHFYYIDPWTEALNTDLTVYYKLDESSGNAIDSVGAQEGIVQGATQGVSGKIGTAYSFTTNDYVNLTDQIDVADAPMSVNMWLILDENDYYNAMVGGGIGAGLGCWAFYSDDDGDLVFGRRGGAEIRSSNANHRMATGAWLMATVVYNSDNTVDFYINGTLATGNMAFSSTFSCPVDYVLGAGSGAYWEGDIDEFGFWERELTSTEITQLYNDYSGITYTDDFGVEITANATKPDIVHTNTDWLINITATDANSLYISAFTKFYVNDSNVTGEIFFNMTNNTNQLVATLLNGNFSGGDTLIAEVWLSNGVKNSTKVNLTEATVQFLNISGTLKDGNSNNLNASVFVVNQSDNSLVGNTTSLNGIWIFGPVLPGTYIITGYDPTNSTLDGDAEPHVVVP